LKYSHGLVTNQFTFCVFVAARVLLGQIILPFLTTSIQ
jgi:hypothetical protein